MAKPEAEQLGLDGVPQAPKRKINKVLEQIRLDDDDIGSQITVLLDKRAELREAANKKMNELQLEVYTYKRADGGLMDLVNTSVLRKRKSAHNPKKSKASAEA
jgi:hypothetical protein